MEKTKPYQPELELKHNHHGSQRIEAGRLAGRLAVDAVAAIAKSFRHRPNQDVQPEAPDRVVIDLIEDNQAYGSIMGSDGNEHQLVLPLAGLNLIPEARNI